MPRSASTSTSRLAKNVGVFKGASMVRSRRAGEGALRAASEPAPLLPSSAPWEKSAGPMPNMAIFAGMSEMAT